MSPNVTRRFVVATAILTVPLLTSCALPRLEAPRLSIIAMHMQSADLFSQRLSLRMRVLNPNARALPIEGISYRVEVNGTELGRGLANEPFVVPALGEAEFDVQMTANLAGAIARLLLRRDSREALEYRLVGNVALSSGFLRRIPFDERGRVRL